MQSVFVFRMSLNYDEDNYHFMVKIFIVFVGFLLLHTQSAYAASRTFDLAFEKVTSQSRPAAKHFKVAMAIVNKSATDMEITDQICYHAALSDTTATWSGCVPGLHHYQKKMRLFFMIPEGQKGKIFTLQLDPPTGYEDPNSENNSASITVQ